MSRNTKILFFLLLISAFSMLEISVADAQCAMCKASAESNLKNGEQAVGRGLNDGILYLMTVPYLILAFLAWYLFREKIRQFFSMFKNIYNDPKI